MQTASMRPPTRDRAGATAIRNAIVRSRERFWRPGDFDAAESTVLHIFGALTRSGEMTRIRRGLYWRGAKTVLGMSPPPPDLLVAEIVGTAGVGAAGLSAANELGLSTQIPRRALVAVTGTAPKGAVFADFVARPSQTERLRQKLTPREVAFLEVLSDLSVSELGSQPTWSRLTGIVQSDTVRPHQLVNASRTEPAVTRARLAQLLKDAGKHDLAAKVPATDPRVRRRSLELLRKPSESR